MALTDLSKLEDKIFTCSLRDLIDFYDLDKKDLILSPFNYTRSFQISTSSNVYSNISGIYASTRKYVQLQKILAVSDARISESFVKIPESFDIQNITVYGTALKLK